MKSSILVVEDEPAIQELISVILTREGYQVSSVSSAEEAGKAIREILPVLLIVDWMLPGQSGVSLIKNLRAAERTRDLPVILLTARAHEEDRVLGLESGADDYITKPFSTKELVARVRAVVRRRTPHLSEEEIKIGSLILNPATRKTSSNNTPVDLGPTEFKLLHFFMTHPERVFNRTQLLNAIWGDHVFIDERTVDVHIRRLRSALEPSGHHGRLETVRGAGYCFRGNTSL